MPGTPNPPLADYGYGLGIGRYDLGDQYGGVVWLHSGATPGNSLFIYFPKSNIVITMASNVDISSYTYPVFLDLAKIVINIILNSPEWHRSQLQMSLSWL